MLTAPQLQKSHSNNKKKKISRQETPKRTFKKDIQALRQKEKRKKRSIHPQEGRKKGEANLYPFF